MQNNNSIQADLNIRNVSKDFSGNYALKEVSMQFFPGQVTAVIGENGAGKSTLMKIVSGIYPDYEGEIFYQGEQISIKTPKEAAKKGIVIIHQELNLIPNLSVSENIFLGQELKSRLGLLDYQRMYKKTRELLARLQLDVEPDTPVGQLRVGEQQLVEIARALLFNSRVLIMDEPTSAISVHEVKLLFRIIKELRSQQVSIVYISHKLNELFEIADRYEVLRDGRLVGSGLMQEISHEKLIRLMVGRKIEDRIGNEIDFSGEEVLRVENLCLQNPANKNAPLVQHVSFTLHKGEVIGIYGLMGAGRSELLETIFGLHPKHSSGKINIEENEIEIRNVNTAIEVGIGLVPEDRKFQGLVLNMNVIKNTSLASLKNVSSFGFIDKKKDIELGNKYISKLNTSVPSVQIEVSKLSGGNQQKVVLAKWLATNPKILLLDEPTRGIDIGAKAEIYRLIKELSEQGIGIVIVSSELPEILAISDTILVLSESKLTASLKRNEANEEIIMTAAISEKQ